MVNVVSFVLWVRYNVLCNWIRHKMRMRIHRRPCEFSEFGYGRLVYVEVVMVIARASLATWTHIIEATWKTCGGFVSKNA